MAKPFITDIDLLRTHAWVADVAMVCGSITKPATVTELMKRAWLSAGRDAPDFPFKRWAGDYVVSQTSVKLVDQCLAFERKSLCSGVFTDGPCGIPLWWLLEESCPDEQAMAVIDEHLCPSSRDEVIRAFFTKRSFSEKVDMLWENFVGRKVDFAEYEMEQEGNVIIDRFEQDEIMIDLWTLSLFLAVRHLAERKKDRRSEARYMFDAVLAFVPSLLMNWNVALDVKFILEQWRATSDPMMIANMDVIDDQTTGTPLGSGRLHRKMLKQLDEGFADGVIG